MSEKNQGKACVIISEGETAILWKLLLNHAFQSITFLTIPEDEIIFSPTAREFRYKKFKLWDHDREILFHCDLLLCAMIIKN